ncbi:recombinase family protein [Geobacter sp.]|uniref:recombinase family protein n=1 Tax=Geobacter sp. TaxID=46610 RepID=UPI001AC3A0C4|nr:recombinase family protein [Geobacter sp.]CAG0968776.1 DNA-invertase hin [Anaerolineales bacterium]
MATYGYIRVSTDKQDLETQKFGILNFANEKGLGQVALVEEAVSGRVSWKNRELHRIIDGLCKGDVLIVTELSRLGRSMLEVMELLSIMTKKEVKVFAIKGGYELGNNIQSKVLAFAFALAAEIERELISDRTKEALAKKKAEGVKLGRPSGRLGKSKLDGQEEEIGRLLEHKVPAAAIARLLKVSRPTLLGFIKSRNLTPN